MKLPFSGDPDFSSITRALLQQGSPDPMSERSCVSSTGNERRRCPISVDGGGSDDGGSDDRNPRKNHRTNNSASNGGVKEIISSLLLLEEQESRDREGWARVSAQEKDLLDSNHRKKAAAMLDYYSDLQSYYAEWNESDRASRKRARLARSTAAAVAAIVSESAAAATHPGDGVASAAAGHHRRLWVKDRSQAWWDECSKPDFPEEEFRRAFRMGRETFDLICDELKSVVAKEDTMLRQAIPVRQRVAVCIWRLATGEPLRLVSKRFGLGISTCHKLVLEVCNAIRVVLMPKYLQWPDELSLGRIKEQFESVSGIPNVVGAMYTTHIPIIAPKISVAAYFNKRHTERNQKNSYSITVQGVIDPNGAFTDVCIGWPGSMHDDQVLEKSALYQRANGGLLKGVWIVGTSGHPLLDWVLVPYAQQHLTWTQHAFNEKIGEIQNVAKEAFARLKGRWCCLQKRTEVKLQDLPVVLGACCVLHNICEIRKEGIHPELRIDLLDDETVPEIALRSATSLKARDAIAHNLLHHSLAGTAFL